MKKIIATILILAIMLCFTGCNKNATSSADGGYSSAQSEHTKLDEVQESNVVQNSSEPQSNSQISSNNTTKNEDTTSGIDKDNSSTQSEHTKPDDTPESSVVQHNSEPQSSSQTSSDDAAKTETKTLTATNGDEIKISLTTGNNPKINVSVNDKEIFNCKDFKDNADQYDFEKDFNLEVINEYSEGYINWAYQFKWGVVLSTATEGSETSYWASAKHQYEHNVYRQQGLGTLVEKWQLLELNDAGKYWNSEKLAEAIVETMYNTKDCALIETDDLSKMGYTDEKYARMRGNELSSSSQFQKIYEVSVKNEVVALLCVDAATYFLEIQELDWKNPQPVTFKIENNKLVYVLY